ncbi:hypothetical protein PHYSODRAFT_320945 [Phytophthora sojae]|uniref:Uncharacterized protein n=1 Tax=Phytophthora sojae (strain P6497) TaxID=1094619 RepID=G4YJW9_PHYSP|nr:hypothetical protein PHYSODRAFT_320945 [Phytophthora sojae]EGZ27101.1 hypothetical protein PHYSODRAFT_320945 [Phytophthora sojae]|eukprot:XP_009514376.1 hypothetical protein PHYSODRAFT_320945 [Phytophthora sojae]
MPTSFNDPAGKCSVARQVHDVTELLAAFNLSVLHDARLEAVYHMELQLGLQALDELLDGKATE